MDEAFAAMREHQLALTRAFEAACKELGIGAGSLDVWRKERLARILEAFAKEDTDWFSLAGKAVATFLSEAAASEVSHHRAFTDNDPGRV